MILGRHTLIELHGCSASALSDLESIRTLMVAAVKQAGGTYVTDVFHHFTPLGVSGVIVISESHVTIHTWPEHGYAGADIFTCGTRVKPEKAAKVIIAKLKPSTHSIILMERGIIASKQKAKG